MVEQGSSPAPHKTDEPINTTHHHNNSTLLTSH